MNAKTTNHETTSTDRDETKSGSAPSPAESERRLRARDDGDDGFEDSRRDRHRGRKSAAEFGDYIRETLEDLVEAPHHILNGLPPVGSAAESTIRAVIAKTDAAFVEAHRMLHVFEELIGERDRRIDDLEAALKAAGVTP